VKQIFFKYEGTGNDFILIDNRNKNSSFLDSEFIAHLCHRRFGIGADGLILLEEEGGFDFKMVYFNADGRQSTMCGNGGRCIAAFAHHLGIVSNIGIFNAIDGPHAFKISEANERSALVSLKMKDVKEITKQGEDYILDTGSPHFIRFVEETKSIDVFKEGREIRNSEQFGEGGINVNFVSTFKGNIIMRTYERGVEDETLSCGTGVTAAALASVFSKKTPFAGNVSVRTKGGELSVQFKIQEQTFSDIWLIGPANLVFKGELPF
jgi:diaminopimelate epimerase